MHKNLILFLTVVPTAAVLAGTAASKKDGIFPTASLPLTRHANSSCGSCHNPFVGGPTVTVAPKTRVLSPNQGTTVTVSATGGAPGGSGGFCADVTAGSLVAGSNSQVSFRGTAITHVNPSSRSWTFGYKAPGTPGPVELYAVVNTVNGNGKTSGDQFAFHGASSTSTV
ncbi:MAG: choice-of-anchor V domain-containing protein, partial [Planctomycetota bacterium]